MRRGEIWVADLEPVRGSEANNRRPVVIVSRDAANRSVQRLGRGVVTVVPVASNVSRVLAFQVLVEPSGSGLDRPSKLQAERVRSVAVERLVGRIGQLSAVAIADLDRALRLHLAL